MRRCVDFCPSETTRHLSIDYIGLATPRSTYAPIVCLCANLPPTHAPDNKTQVTLEQCFVNPTEAKEALEITYRFPLDAEAVLRGFTVELEDGTVVKGQVQEKEKAADTYDDALASGHGGFLLQEDNEMKDVFSLRVGNLPPGGSATVRLTYVAQIDEEVPEEAGGNSVVRFVLPTAVAPRYSPAGDQPPELYQHAAALLADWPKDLLKIKGTVTAASPILALYPHTFKEETSLELAGSNTASFALTAGHLGRSRRLVALS